MSAIAGIIHPDGRPVDRALIDRMQAILTPYGRDSQNCWCHANVALSRALCRITPEDSLDHQPLRDAASGMVVVFDGRIDNRAELGNLLEVGAREQRLMSDADMVARACQRWDSAAVRYLLGDYAVACWQPRLHRLWLARDPMGQRPLYWIHQQGTFAFATMPKALFAIPHVERALCEERLADYLTLTPTPSGLTFFKNVFRVDPGQIVSLDGEKLSMHKFHNFDPGREIRLAKDDDYVEAFREHLDRAVACRLRANGPIASHLSSGFDSSTVTAIAARQLGERNQALLAYTAVPRQGFAGPVGRGRHADEGPGARALACRFSNIEHILIRTNGCSPIENLAADVRLLDRAPLNPVNMPWTSAIEQDAASRGAKCILTGQRGNHSISYRGEDYLPTLLRQGRWVTWWSEASAIRRQHPRRTWRGLMLASVSPYLPMALWDQIVKWRGTGSKLSEYTAIHPDFMNRMNVRQRARNIGWSQTYRPFSNSRQRRISGLTRHDNGDYFAAANASAGLEIRDPTNDLRLLEFCLAVPDDQYLRQGQDRWLLRRLMQDVLPPEILDARTAGQQAADWYEDVNAMLPRLRDELRSLKAHEGAAGYLDLDALEQAVNNWPDDGWHSDEIHDTYCLKLLRGLAVGSFIQYVEASNS